MQEILFVKFHRRSTAPLQIQEPRQIQNDRKLGELGRLNTDGTKPDPAVRGMRLVEEKRSDEHQQDEEDGRVHDRGFAQAAVIRPHQSKHAEQAEKEPRSLPQQKDIRAAVLLVGGDGRSAVDHHRAQQAERKRYAK